MRNIWGWVLLLFVLSIDDFLTTSYGIGTGIFRETNPVLIWAIENYGVIGILYVKLTVILVLVLSLLLPKQYRPKCAPRFEFYIKFVTICQGLVTFSGFGMLLWWIYE